jgi:hypothetical protein
MSKKTFGLGLNDKNPVDAELRRRLEAVDNQADLLRTALLFYLDEAGRENSVTQQEVDQLRAEIASLRQNQAAPAPDPSQQVLILQSELEFTIEQMVLTEKFKAAVIKAKLPALRLTADGQFEGSKEVAEFTANATKRAKAKDD